MFTRSSRSSRSVLGGAALVGALLAGGLASPASATGFPIQCSGPTHASGTLAVGETLTGSASFSGGPATAYYYYWYRLDYVDGHASYTEIQGNDLNGVNSANYTLTEAEYGHQVEVDVEGDSGDDYYDYCDGSAALTGVIGRIGVPVAGPTGILGRAKVGKTLAAAPGSLRPGTVVSYQWLRATKVRRHHRTVLLPIAGATGPVYKLRSKDRGKKVSVQMVYTRAGNVPTVVLTGGKKVH